MSIKPILFSTPMVQAILAGRKTMTRRVLKTKWVLKWIEAGFTDDFIKDPGNNVVGDCPYQPGDILWVRETWNSFFPEEVTINHHQGPRSCSGVPAESAKGHYMHYYYRADGEIPDHPTDGKAWWEPPIFMPRAAARIFLRVTDVRVERVQEITEEDAIKEGCEPRAGSPSCIVLRSARGVFRDLWNELSKARGTDWYTNEWVWVIEFERCEKPKGE